MSKIPDAHSSAGAWNVPTTTRMLHRIKMSLNSNPVQGFPILMHSSAHELLSVAFSTKYLSERPSVDRDTMGFEKNDKESDDWHGRS